MGNTTGRGMPAMAAAVQVSGVSDVMWGRAYPTLPWQWEKLRWHLPSRRSSSGAAATSASATASRMRRSCRPSALEAPEAGCAGGGALARRTQAGRQRQRRPAGAVRFAHCRPCMRLPKQRWPFQTARKWHPVLTEPAVPTCHPLLVIRLRTPVKQHEGRDQAGLAA